MHVLSNEEIEQLFLTVKKPYSTGEIQSFIREPSSRARERLEHVHYHNYALCNSLMDWQDYRKGVGKRPETSLHLLLTPGYGGANDARASLEYLADFFSGFPHGALPRWPIMAWMSRSAITLVDRLAALHETAHHGAIRRHLDEFIDLMTYRGEPKMTRDKFAERLHSAQSDFLDACERNAIALSQWLDAPEEEEKSAPLSQRRLAIRELARQKMDDLYASGMTWGEAEDKVRAEMWREFNALGLACAKHNFHRLRYMK